MKILGIVHEHNASVCLMEDGKVAFCQSEERLNRIKNSSGFPKATIDSLYRHVAQPENIDLAVVFERSLLPFVEMRRRGFTSVPGSYSLQPSGRPWRARLARTRLGSRLIQARLARVERSAAVRNDAEDYFSRSLSIGRDRIRYVDHHTAHAYSVLPNIRHLPRVLIFTLDCYGDGLCATVSVLEHGELRRISATDERHSLGAYYSATTLLMGMKTPEDEFKVMGLAGYARPAHYQRILHGLRGLLTVDGDGRWRSAPELPRLLASLEALYRHQRFDNIAGAIQALTEELIVRWVKHWVAASGCRDVAVCGGVFMNIKACQQLAEADEIDHLFVMPSAGDETCAIGSAVWGTLLLQPAAELSPIADLYWGSEPGGREIDEALRETGAEARYRIVRPADMATEAAGLLASGQLVARCSGRMEFGARALGNRSILADPRDPSVCRRLNEAVKNRDFWMPFGPSVLEEDMPRYALNAERIFGPYMCVSYASTREAQRDLPAALHASDLTLRPQAVRKAWNPAFYELLTRFKAMTGVGGLLNTSFNLHGEPIVCSCTDAIRTADQSGLQHLILGDFLLSKRSTEQP